MSGTVAVVGSFMMDLAVCAPRRPNPGETLVGTRFDEFLGGKGFNQAVAAARMGASVTMVGRLGDDDFGQRFLHALDRDGIDRAHVGVDTANGTGVGLPLVEDSGENSIVIVPRANAVVDAATIEAASAAIEATDVLLVQLELDASASATAARIAHGAGRTVVLNPAPAAGREVLEQFDGVVDVLVPNEGELARLVGATRSPADDATGLAAHLGCAVVVTLGADGVLVVEGGDVVRVQAHRVDAIDTVGAGDAFCGALGAALARGVPLRDAAVDANAAAALSVTKRGAEPSLPTASEVARLLA